MTTETGTAALHNGRFRADEAALVLQRCSRCQHVPNFPRIACPRCFAELEWHRSTGNGTVRSFTVIHRPHHPRFDAHVPIIMTLIGLDEGAELIATVIGNARQKVDIGSRVRFTRQGWSVLPQFELQSGEEVAQ